MFPWVPSVKSLAKSLDSGSQVDSKMGSKLDSPQETLEVSPKTSIESKDSRGGPDAPRRAPGWMTILPYFLSAFLFLSGFLGIFAPLPILFCSAQKGRKSALLAAMTNGVIVGVTEGWIGFGFYCVLVLALSLPLAEALRRKKSVEKSAGLALVAMVLAAGVGGLIYAGVHHLNPVQELFSRISSFADLIIQSVPPNSGLLNSADPVENKHEVMVILPGLMASFALFLVWLNLLVLLRINPAGIRESVGLDSSYLKKWKAPEFLVWPTIAAGFFLVMDFGLVSDIALNIFRFLMAVYAIQGLSILSFFFDLWNVRGFFRWVGFIVSLLLMMPLVLCLGFFDLWFDFRAKFRQS